MVVLVNRLLFCHVVDWHSRGLLGCWLLAGGVIVCLLGNNELCYFRLETVNSYKQTGSGGRKLHIKEAKIDKPSCCFLVMLDPVSCQIMFGSS